MRWRADGGRSYSLARDADGAATPMGQLAYFMRLLTLSRVVAELAGSLPLSYTSPTHRGRPMCSGTWMLSILSGHRRYSPRHDDPL